MRAIATGMVLGAALSLCNVYSGLKIGWGFNMSVTAVLLGYAWWHALRRAAGTAPFGILENNANQTAASAAASISSAGLSAPIPAWTLLTGETLSWSALALWTFSVSAVGIVVAIGLRRRLIREDRLAFPVGIATAETLREVYAHGREALTRVTVLGAGALVAGALKLAQTLWHWKRFAFPVTFRAAPGGAFARHGVTAVSLQNLGFSLDTSLLLFGVGALIGFRACASILLGALVAWGLLGPRALALGWIRAGAPGASWYNDLLPWLLWPGVAMMVTAALTSVALSWRSALAALRGAAGTDPEEQADDVSRRSFLLALGAVFLLAVGCQVGLFGIRLLPAVAAVLLTFLLAVVTGRVAGETGITPVGAMGKVTQLLMGVLSPGNPTTNLMSANVTGGAAAQVADLLQDLKTGDVLGASPRVQAVAQTCGLFAGALAGPAAYLLLVPDPRRQLLTDAWPAPSVAAWKAVAEIFMRGVHAMPPGSLPAAAWGAMAGVALELAEKRGPARLRPWVPSAASVGLGFVIPAYNSVSLFLGGAAALAVQGVAPAWSARFVVVLAAGLIAGESLMGVAVALHAMLTGGR